MSFVIVETAAEQAITDEYLEEMDRIGVPCLQARNIGWRYSLLSLDQYRMICTFDAPDTGSVREAYARMGLQRKIWPGQFFRSDMFPSEADRPNLYVIEGSIPNLSEADWNEMWQKFLQSCQAARLEWLQLYISLDRRHFLSEFYAPDVESLQAIQQQVELPYDRIWPAQRLQP
jgi:hypothetical protein